MKTKYTIGDAGKVLIAVRSFTAPLLKVWQAWTDSNMLDKWWGPLPYKAITQSYSFTEGGEWRYYMEGPSGDRHNCLNTYITINPQKEFTAEDVFCNEDGSINTSLPKSHWRVEFTHADGITTVHVTTTYNTSEDLTKVSKMGMKEGFNQGLNQLEALLVS